MYLYFTTAEGLKLERWAFADDTLQREATLVSDIEAGPIHDSGRIAFGPDDRLYVATGDAGNGDLAQDDGSLNGKYLRLAPAQYRGDAEVRPEIVSKGHRNPQGFDWAGDRMISTEHGPSGGDGPQGFDEVNEIREGGNYGWPEAFGEDHEGFDAPLRVYEEAIAPSGATFVDARRARRGRATTCSRCSAARACAGCASTATRSPRTRCCSRGEFGRLRTVVEGPDGELYVMTSNQDGRGDPSGEDDRILAVTPPG